MCGICGAVNLDGTGAIDPLALQLMNETMVHRGPDSAGQVRSGSAGLAMRRLSIIDLEGGQQPLTNESETVFLVCNGEIYNYRELGDSLRVAGHRFRTGSDCETIVHAYEEYGPDGFLNRLNGMFGLALWDTARGRLILARDRTGIKPLYYAEHRGALIFASEPKAILAYPGFPRELDLTSLGRYLAFEYVPTPHCIFKGIRRLRPGHCLIVEGGRLEERAYWQPDLTPDPALTRLSESELAERVWETLKGAVRQEMVSDVPIGVFLSGGLDSSAVAAAMTEAQPGRVRSFSIGFSDPSFDESPHARQVAQALGTDHQELILEPRALWELVPRVAEFLDEPLADASIIPTHLLSRFARQHVTVALGGDGGDELFAGYSTVQAHRLAGYYRRVPAALRERVIGPIVRRLPVSYDNQSFDFKAKRFILAVDHPVPMRHHRWLGAYGNEDRRSLLLPEIRAELAGQDPYDVLDDHADRFNGYDDISQVLAYDLKMYLEGDILVKVDRASMGCSLEVRVPLLNKDLLDLVLPLPVDYKLRRLTRKYILRKAVAGRLPANIVDRPKQGFIFPVSKWLRTELRDLLLDLLSEDRLKRQGLFDSAYVHGLIADHLAGRRDNRKLLWTLLIFQLWSQRRLESAPAGLVAGGASAGL